MNSYEKLLVDTDASFANIVRYLELDYCDNALKKAIGYASFDTTKKFESMSGRPLHSRTIDGSFLRSGKPGEWKEYFGSSAVDKAVAILQRKQINCTEWDFDL